MDGKTATLNIPLGNILEKLTPSGAASATACSVAVLIPVSSMNFPTKAITPGSLTIYSNSELSEVTYDNYPFMTAAYATGHPTTVPPRLLAYHPQN